MNTEITSKAGDVEENESTHEKTQLFVNYNTNLSLKVVYSFGLRVLSVVLCEDVIHRALQVSVYLGRHKKNTQCLK